MEELDAMIDADWNGGDFEVETDTEETAEPETEETEVETEVETEDTTEEVKEPEPAPEAETPAEEVTPELFTLKHLDETRSVNKDEVIALAQKGLDYDRIRERSDEYESFLKEMANGRPITDLIDSVRAAKLAKDTGLDEKTALERVKLDRERKAFEAEKERSNNASTEKQREEARRQESFAAFVKARPGVKADAIPKEVWAEFNKSGDLLGAYEKYEAKQLREEVEALRKENEALKQNTKNKERTAGSRKTAGNKSSDDGFDASWYDGT